MEAAGAGGEGGAGRGACAAPDSEMRQVDHSRATAVGRAFCCTCVGNEQESLGPVLAQRAREEWYIDVV